MVTRPHVAAAGALDWDPLRACATLRVAPPATAIAEMTSWIAERPIDGLLIAPDGWPARPVRPPWPHDRPLPEEADQHALYDDGAWSELLERSLKRPWFWLAAGLTQLGAAERGAIVVVVPRRVDRLREGPDEATARATLKGFVRAAAERAKTTEVRVNAVELAGRELDPRAAELLRWLVSPEGSAVAGQVLTAR